MDVVSQNPNDVVPFIKAGRLRLLSSLSSKRWEWVPDVPTVRELGYDIAIEGWYGLAAPKGIPRPIMEKLVQIFKMATNDPEFLGIMKNLYTPAVYRSPEECRKIVEEQLALHAKIISDLGLHKSQQQSK